jgi:SAM-dependent methyltransferase
VPWRKPEANREASAIAQTLIMLTQRRLTPEHMDDPNASREELATALAFLRVINARLRGTAVALRQFRTWLNARAGAGEPVRILDIGTGSADIPLAIARYARSREIPVHITAIDRHPVTCDLAREYLRSDGGECANDIEVVEADALKLTDRFAAGSFEYAHAGLFLHHLQDIEVMTVLRIMDRLASRGMIWNDLVRVGFPPPRVMLWPFLIGAPAIVKHDALVSVQAGFTRREAIELAQRADWIRPTWRRHLVHRFTLVSEKPGVAAV